MSIRATIHVKLSSDVFFPGARETGNPTENNRITVQFVVRLYDDVSYIGQSYWVGAAVEIGSDQIWAGEILVMATAFVPVVGIVT